MKNNYISANILSFNCIQVVVYSSFLIGDNPRFLLLKNGSEESVLKIKKRTSSNSLYFYELETPFPIELGNSYSVGLDGDKFTNLDVSEAINFPEFDSLYNYAGNDLGAIYCKEETKFSLWAPLASQVFLKLEKEDDDFILLKMDRTENGVYRITVKGDLLNHKYSYLVTNSGVERESLDPYGKGVSLNSQYSAVVDIETVKKMGNISIKEDVDVHNSIIYELHIRDFTENKHTNIINKSKYLGLVEESKETENHHPAGLDYLKYLGVTHIQILPIMDFYGVDDVNNKKEYNWGYNPLSFFALEGSYSIHPETPMSRLVEFKTMVNKLHENNIKVILDVVYNHVYEYMSSCFEKCVPHYFFRKKANGQLANNSGCGNDFASEKYMARKMIKDSIEYFTDIYDIDGLRFDLMGLLDIPTIKQSISSIQKKKKDFLTYGEGWEMGYELPSDVKGSIRNIDRMPNVGFFNDIYRDVIKGPSFADNLYCRGFTCGNSDNFAKVFALLNGSVSGDNYTYKFTSSLQSINYVECHDNYTLFDKLLASNADEGEDTILQRVKFANALIMFSFGASFFHMGQEIGLSKRGLGNSYNIININNMDYHLVDERFDMVNFFHFIAHIRKNKLPYLHFDKLEDIQDIFAYDLWNNGMICLKANNYEKIKPYHKLVMLINPTNHEQIYELDEYYTYLSASESKEKIHTKNGIVAPATIQIYYI